MKRPAIAALLCLLHLAFILLPEVQVWQYIALLSQQQTSNEISFNNDSKSPLTGDITYLKALIDRSKESADAKQQNKIPETTVSHTGLVYLPFAEEFNKLLNCKSVNNFTAYTKNPRCGISRVLSPPPRITFC
ncbi:MAG: hypothetical protein KJ578_13965 [Bacteroidetes bacterium]|nr:hypothetical protein [Bacteroidota bacterium]MBU1581084.1 hypothetical protein [Bacteroidota bacterium]MBU2558879.1 hypothetical protein [Bacteroidota bacterium]